MFNLNIWNIIWTQQMCLFIFGDTLMGWWFKTLRMCWYKSMKPFLDNLELVIKKYLWSLYDSFSSIDSISNEQVLIGMSKYIYSHNYISVFVLICYLLFYSNDNCNFNEFLYLVIFKTWIWYRRIYMEFSKQCCPECLADYTYVDYVYYKNMTDIPNKILIISY